MKKSFLIGAMMCWMALNAQAQYQYDRALPLPTVDLYDTGVMNMYMRALAETSARRQQSYEQYSELAFDAFHNEQWGSVIDYVNRALNTKFYCGDLFYIRGYAYEQLGNLKAAKKDYKAGKKYNCIEAAQALEALKAKKKTKR
jgi:tetratricopeptide (TPR) repeat protein